MPVLDHLNESRYRDYPLVENPPALTGPSTLAVLRGWILDAGITFGVYGGYRYQVPVTLVRVDANGTNVTFVVGDGRTYFRFTFPATASFGQTAFAEGQETSGPGSVPNAALGFGFCQVGDVSDWAGRNGTWTGTAELLPTRVQSLDRHKVRVIKVANEPPVLLTDPCLDPPPSQTQGWQVTLGSGVAGPGSCNHTNGLTAGSSCRSGTVLDAVKTAINGSVTLTNCGNVTVPWLVSGKINPAFRVVLAKSGNNWVGHLGLDDNYPNGDFDYDDMTWSLTVAPCTLGTPSTDPLVYPTGLVPSDGAMTGAVGFAGGYYTTLDLDAAGGVAQVNVTAKPELSEELPCDPEGKLVYPIGYTPAQRLKCSELITTINGITSDPQSHAFALEGSQGISVAVGPDEHSLQVVIDQNLLFAPPPADPGCPACLLTLTQGSGGGSVDQVLDLGQAFAGNATTAAVDLIWESFTVADRLQILDAAGGSVYDTGANGVATNGPVLLTTSLEATQNPFRLKVTASSGTPHWYWRIACTQSPPVVQPCDYVVQLAGGTTAANGSYTLVNRGNNLWTTNTPGRGVLRWFNGKWDLTLSDGSTGSIAWQAVPGASGLIPQGTAPWGSPVLNTFGGTPGTLTVTQSCSTPLPPQCEYQGAYVAGGDAGYDQHVDLSAELAAVTPLPMEVTFQSYEIKDRLKVTGNNGTVLYDSGCVGTGREVTTTINVQTAHNPIRIQVIPDCAGQTGTGWYWRLGCKQTEPNCSAASGCSYTVKVQGGTFVDGTYTLAYTPGGGQGTCRWVSPLTKAVIRWLNGRWSLVVTDGHHSVVYEADNTNGVPPTSGWVLKINSDVNSTPPKNPILSVFKNCP